VPIDERVNIDLLFTLKPTFLHSLQAHIVASNTSNCSWRRPHIVE